MVNYTLQNLTIFIKKCCTALDSEDVSNRYKFALDSLKLDNMLKQKKTNLHVIAFNRSLESKVPTINDIQLISEYVHDPKLFKKIFDGKSEFISFMLFSTYNEKGPISLEYMNENDELCAMSDKEIFASCNTDIDEDCVVNICKDLPCYRVLIVRTFNTELDKFEYKVNIRSNYSMVTFQKSNKDETSSDK